MHGLARGLGAAIGGLNLFEAAAARVTRYTMVTLAVAAAVFCALAALGCAVAALCVYALPYVGAVGVLLIAAGVLLAACLAAGATAWQVARRRRRRSAPAQAQVPTDAMVAAATYILEKERGSLMMAAVVAGLVAGAMRRR